MKAGRMDRVVTLRQATVAQDDYGQPIETWTDLAEVWASRVELKGAERWAAKQVLSEISAKYWIRWRDDVTDRLRLVDDSTEYNIQAVSEIGRREGLELIVSTIGV